MANRKERLDKRNTLIKADFKKMCAEKRYKLEYILEELEKKYLPLSAATIYHIVAEQGAYKNEKDNDKK